MSADPHERVAELEAENARLREALSEIARLAGLMNRGLQPRIGMIADAAAAALRPTTTDTSHPKENVSS
jgi:hypothetical protein